MKCIIQIRLMFSYAYLFKPTKIYHSLIFPIGGGLHRFDCNKTGLRGLKVVNDSIPWRLILKFDPFLSRCNISLGSVRLTIADCLNRCVQKCSTDC